jgi:hypothetical protein
MDGRLILQWLLLLLLLPPPLLPPLLLMLRQHAMYRQGEETHKGMGTDAVCV